MTNHNLPDSDDLEALDTALAVATPSHRWKQADQLLEIGANINGYVPANHAHGDLPVAGAMRLFALCVYNGDDKAVQFMLKRGAQIRVTGEPENVFHQAFQIPIIDHPDRRDADRVRVMATLLRHITEEDATFRNEDGDTPLLLAARSGWFDLAFIALLASGAGKDDLDADGNTALDILIQKGRTSSGYETLRLYGGKHASELANDAAGNTAEGLDPRAAKGSGEKERIIAFSYSMPRANATELDQAIKYLMRLDQLPARSTDEDAFTGEKPHVRLAKAIYDAACDQFAEIDRELFIGEFNTLSCWSPDLLQEPDGRDVQFIVKNSHPRRRASLHVAIGIIQACQAELGTGPAGFAYQESKDGTIAIGAVFVHPGEEPQFLDADEWVAGRIRRPTEETYEPAESSPGDSA